MTAHHRFLWIALFALAFLTWTPAAPAQIGPAGPPPHSPHPKPTAESLAEGKTLFEGTCAGCHGLDGSGANGPNIRQMGKILGPEGVYTVIYTGGAMGSGMPAFFELGREEHLAARKLRQFVQRDGRRCRERGSGEGQRSL